MYIESVRAGKCWNGETWNDKTGNGEMLNGEMYNNETQFIIFLRMRAH